MLIKELINILKKYDENLPVLFKDSTGGYSGIFNVDKSLDSYENEIVVINEME